jgi:hypothetical protein
MKQKLGEEYLNRTKSTLKTKLNGKKNAIKAINTYVTPGLIFSVGIVKWTPTDLENLQTKMRTLPNRYRYIIIIIIIIIYLSTNITRGLFYLK